MSISKVERQLNLVICLLSTRQFISAEQIRSSVAGYGESAPGAAFNRMFERDKADLRELGIPLETGTTPGGTAGDGYRINRDDYELPPIEFDRDEAAAVAMAAALWDSPEMANAAQSALLKLRAAGVDLDNDALADIHASSPRGIGSESVLNALLSAVNRRRAVTFRHRSASNQPWAVRTLEPWRVVTANGRWYVVGRDRDRDETRTFRLSRIGEPVELIGSDGDVVAPDTDITAIVTAAISRSEQKENAVPARIWLAADRAAGLRRIASRVIPGDRAGRAGDVAEFDTWSRERLARLVLGAGEDAVVLEPDELRDHVVAALRDLVAAR
ncbi:YafY family protein [Williamsia sp. CHRR-6]|uniref:helix-turn-helix transcriptional regulator n=1 Tax=Williamsia sp. CHRR-6 TaxID=2835871 RepID=UPI001BDB3159|nr:WYL domain-containing protein [Williamsia sp. CHRR-6]MBT0568117.1 WYL domain-containing protein [Williamsia sp. CHRR-6]